MPDTITSKLIDLKSFITNPVESRLYHCVEQSVEKMLSLRLLNETYQKLKFQNPKKNSFDLVRDIRGP
jgi:hypothetical protein